MGVLGLWQALDPIGHPIKIEALEGKRLSVDASVWLYKFIRGFRDKDNAPSIDGHKLGLFNRLCKLLFYKIKPVFVFDGPAPVLKRKTLEKRQSLRNKNLAKVQDTAMRLLAEQIKGQYPNANLEDITIRLPELRSHNLVAAEKLTEEDDQLFYLPPAAEEFDSDDEEFFSATASLPSQPSSQVKQENTVYHIDSSDEEIVLDVKPEMNEVDIHSDDFAKLPAEVRYEILTDIKESKRKIRRREALPEDSNSFSNLQLERLAARRVIQQKIEDCEKDICSMYTGAHDGELVRSFRVQSNANSTMLYVKHNSDTSMTSKEANPFPELKVRPETTSTAKEEEKEDKQQLQTVNRSLMRPLFDMPHKDPTKTDHVIRLGSISRKIIPSSSKDSPIKSPSFSESSSSSESEHDSTILIESSILSSSPECTPQKTILIDTSHHESPELVEITPSLSEKLTTAQQEPTPQVGEQIQEEQDEPIFLEEQTLRAEQTLQERQISREEEEPTLQDEQTSQKESIPLETTTHQSQDELPEKSEIDVTIRQAESNNQQEKESISSSQAQVVQKEVTLTASQREELREARATSTRVTNKVTVRIVEEAKELLRLFGIPYIDATGEAEAQCALLEELKLTEGTITDDSDVWLFGAKNVYRYFFSDDKYVMQYKMSEIEYHIHMNRENLICFAMLVGSDYTDGIRNVGPVTALEILSEFRGDGIEPLLKFRRWREKYSSSKDKIPGSRTREKLLKYRLPEDFPSRAVYEGYLRPVADTSTEQFSWGVPELDELREYARRNFGWDSKKIDDKLLPVMKKVNEKQTQRTLDSFFFKTAANQNPELFRSKRVNQALNKISASSSNNNEVALTEDEDDSSNNEEEATNSDRSKLKKKGNTRRVQVKKKDPPKKETALRKKRKVKGR